MEKSWNCVFEFLWEPCCGEQEKESIICVRVGYNDPSLGITACHHSASLVMPNGDPRDAFFYPTLTLMIDFYSLCFWMFA